MTEIIHARQRQIPYALNGFDSEKLTATNAKSALVESGDYRLDAARFTIDVDEFDSALAKARVTADDETAARFPERRRLTQSYLGALRA